MAEVTEESVGLRGRVLNETELVGLLRSWREGFLNMEMGEEIGMVEEEAMFVLGRRRRRAREGGAARG